MIRLLYVSSVSACFELENAVPFYAPSSFSVMLNGAEIRQETRNVFSLFSLRPASTYTLELRFPNGRSEMLGFETKTEACALDVRAFGAVGDGETDDTSAIQTAIACMPSGSRLFFPAGIYCTAPFFLKSHITLEFKEGARLLGSAERKDYPVIPGSVPDADTGKDVYFGAFEGNCMPMYQSLLTASYAEDIAIVGPGCVDGNAQNSDWWQVFRTLPAARPRLLFLNRCSSVTLHGIEACNSASWQLHPYFSSDISFYDVSVSAPKNSPNTDALDPESCDGVNIVGCRFSVGDDCIAIKSGKIELGRKLKQPASRHVIRNCLMEYGHGAVTLGSEIGAGVRDLIVRKCLFRGTDRGLRIKTRRGRGEDCRITDVTFDNIRMESVLTPIVINMWYNCCDPDRFSEYVWSRETLPVDERTPHLGSFSFSNIVCTDAEVAACYIDGLPESPIDSVRFENISVSFAADARPGIPAMENFAQERCRLGFYLANVRQITLCHVTVRGAAGPVLIADHYETLSQEDLNENGDKT